MPKAKVVMVGGNLSMTTEEKARTPCLYHAQGKCMRGNECLFSHTATATLAPSQESAKAPKAAAKSAAKAAAGLVAVAIALSSLTGADSHYLDWVGDTGAGEWLGSREALHLQGYDLPPEFETCTSKPLRFTTGGERNEVRPQLSISHGKPKRLNKCVFFQIAHWPC